MKKTLIIANMLFASATVWGMIPNDNVLQTGNRGSVFDISKKDIGLFWTKIIDGYEKSFSTVNENGNTPMQVAKKKEELKRKLYKCRKSFEIAQSGLKKNKWLSKGTKLLFSKLNFEDISYYIKEMSVTNFSKEDNSKIEERTKEKAKSFFKQVLGDSILGKDLFERAVKTIDSAEYIRYPYILHSSSTPSGIRCYYREEDDLFFSMVHETSHILDWFYRLRKKLGQSEAVKIFKNGCSFETLCQEGVYLSGRQSEYVSVFFETLLGTDHFRESLVDSYSQRFRIWDLFRNLLNSDFVSELAVSYDKEQLNSFILKDLDINKVKWVISELKKNDKIKLYIDLYQEFGEVLKEPLNKAQEDIWKNLLQKADGNKYTKLGQLLRDIENGESYICSFCYREDDVFTFSKNSQKIEKILPKISGISWEQIYIWLKNKEVIKKEELSWINFLQNLNDKDWNECGQLLREIDKDESDIIGFSYYSLNGENIFQFYTDSEIKTYIPPQLSKIDLVEIGELVRSRLENRGMKNHFRSLLKALDNADYEELSQLLHDTKEGQGELVDYEPNKKIITDFIFSKNSEKIKVSLPQLHGVDWEEINKCICKKHLYFGIQKWLSDNIESANKISNTSVFTDEEHVLGIYNAFKMFKRKNYGQVLNDENSLPIEDVMKELTESELTWSLESIEEFSEFLRTEELPLSEKIGLNVIENLLQYARLHPLESMNQEMFEFLKIFEQYKPLDITEESAEEFLEFLRRH